MLDLAFGLTDTYVSPYPRLEAVWEVDGWWRRVKLMLAFLEQVSPRMPSEGYKSDAGNCNHAPERNAEFEGRWCVSSFCVARLPVDAIESFTGSKPTPH
jgi:hypothetical protein